MVGRARVRGDASRRGRGLGLLGCAPLVFRGSERAWPFWQEIVERDGAAATVPELNVTRERRMRTADGFDVVWLELGANPASLAAEGP